MRDVLYIGEYHFWLFINRTVSHGLFKAINGMNFNGKNYTIPHIAHVSATPGGKMP